MHIRFIQTMFTFLLVLSLVGCGQQAPPATAEATETPAPTNTPVPPSATPTITETPTATSTITPDRAATRVAKTEAAIAEATGQASSMAAKVQKLHDDGYLSTTEGIYHQLVDFDESWAQLNYYNFWMTHLAPADFVIRTDAQWWSASENANWYASGCGFGFHAVDNDNHYVVYLAQGGRVVLQRVLKNQRMVLGISNNIPFNLQSDDAEIMMVVEGIRVTFFVDGEKVFHASDPILTSNALGVGSLTLTLVSGTNKGFGTRCKMTGTEVWYLR